MLLPWRDGITSIPLADGFVSPEYETTSSVHVVALAKSALPM
jgi:hypothetical protein